VDADDCARLCVFACLFAKRTTPLSAPRTAHKRATATPNFPAELSTLGGGLPAIRCPALPRGHDARTLFAAGAGGWLFCLLRHTGRLGGVWRMGRLTDDIFRRTIRILSKFHLRPACATFLPSHTAHPPPYPTRYLWRWAQPFTHTRAIAFAWTRTHHAFGQTSRTAPVLVSRTSTRAFSAPAGCYRLPGLTAFLIPVPGSSCTGCWDEPSYILFGFTRQFNLFLLVSFPPPTPPSACLLLRLSAAETFFSLQDAGGWQADSAPSYRFWNALPGPRHHRRCLSLPFSGAGQQN